MSLDALFQQILLTEQQAEEKRRLTHRVKLEIKRNHEQVMAIKEELREAKIQLETKVQHLSEKLFYLELLKKREDSIEKQKVELVNQKSILLNILKVLRELIFHWLEQGPTFLDCLLEVR
ncbi:coiled-coil domain-containing protein 172 [Alligator mississippiensis]|uniref:Coiled-coil domain-containing protein 172 n=1 Tax=Alligator mississippiensis TaxID=8496 RepID=A0A151NUJ1_ALLMI|nr:coiled-coil domain-containing protein 172 [Alligator mississippiensis]